MEKIYLSNITNELVVEDLLKFVKISGIDLNDDKDSKEKEGILVYKISESTYHLFLQNGSLKIDTQICYSPNEYGILELSAHASIAMSFDLAYHYVIKLINSDTLEIIATLEGLDFKLYEKITKHEKLDKLSPSEIIKRVVSILSEFIEAFKKNQYRAWQKIVEEDYQRKYYIESSFARACGATIENGIISYDNGVKIFSGEKDNCNFLLQYNRSYDKLQNFSITIQKKLPDGTKVFFNISSDMGDNLYLDARKIEGSHTEIGVWGYSKEGTTEEKTPKEFIVDDVCNRVALLEPTTWEDLLVIVSNMINKPLETFDYLERIEMSDKHEPKREELGIPKIKLPITGINK